MEILSPRAKQGSVFFKNLARNRQLHLMILIPVIYVIIFRYIPICGAQIAFKSYRAVDGIFASKWVGLAHFRKFFMSYQFIRVIRNTLGISVYSIIAGFPIPIILALLINSVPGKYFRKTVQLVTYAPYFISTVVFVGLLIQFLSPHVGFYSFLCRLLGIEPQNILGKSDNFYGIYVWSGIWQTAGWASIVYIAALANVDQTIYEAAVIDGATRLQRIIYIDIPSVIPTAIIILIVNMGYAMDVGFEKIYLMQNDLNLSRSEVINTYIYKMGLSSGMQDYSYATAVGLFNSVINFTLVLIVNRVSKKISGWSIW